MIDLTRDEIWASDYDKEIKEKQYKIKGTNKMVKIGLIFFLITLVINVILIYNFFNLLSKV